MKELTELYTQMGISPAVYAYGEETIARLNAAGAEVFRTDECGAISALLGPDGLVRITPMNLPNQSEALP